MTDDTVCMINTNVLVYAFEAADTLKHELAGDLVEEMLERELKAAVSTQILSELFVNITAEKKKSAVTNPLSVKEAKNVLSDVISLAEIAVLECVHSAGVLTSGFAH
ncbi:TPA: PIN domain-containing protein [Candidatus Woesearchaeota archaeon]|nr:PIN domain-containing protein [Candidatus Woesearchaeota archaeon]